MSLKEFEYLPIFFFISALVASIEELFINNFCSYKIMNTSVSRNIATKRFLWSILVRKTNWTNRVRESDRGSQLNQCCIRGCTVFLEFNFMRPSI